MRKLQQTMKPKPPYKAYCGSISDNEQLFILLVALCGLPTSTAYMRAFPTTASAASCSAMGSKLLNDPRIQTALWRLSDMHERGLLTFNDRVLKTRP